ncbi:Hypothetical predicted protein [Mytilus galloprovincialis]|uniref:G-protein coupled receptors family 1 profile domain-containing protein n=1 Tax=Mytilus galloprovincialis TaxID=29158 RepID=A0A8B6EIF0_MYTGA|nr:Hypothetical predicted protein [Mytilus galloprovincialis]
MYASSYVLVTTAIDRYVSICYPITSQTWTNKRIHCMISLAWIMSLLCAVPQLVLFSYQETDPGSDVYDCWENLSTGPIWKLQIYVTWIFVSIYFVPFCILTAVYSRICYVVWISVGSSSNLPETKRYPRKISFNKTYSIRDSNAENAINKPRVHRKAVSNSKLKTIKLTLAVILCYLLCWGPFFVAQMWSAYDFNAPFTPSTDGVPSNTNISCGEVLTTSLARLRNMTRLLDCYNKVIDECPDYRDNGPDITTKDTFKSFLIGTCKNKHVYENGMECIGNREYLINQYNNKFCLAPSVYLDDVWDAYIQMGDWTWEKYCR